MPALAFSLASCPRAGLLEGVLVFLMPALADDHSEPKASPLEEALLAAGDFTDDAAEDVVGCVTGAVTEVK